MQLTSGQLDNNTKNYSVLAAGWWTWSLTQPAATNPSLDKTCTQCAKQAERKNLVPPGIWNTGGTITRSCTIPAHSDLFFPP